MHSLKASTGLRLNSNFAFSSFSLSALLLLDNCSNTTRTYCSTTLTIGRGCVQKLICYGFYRFLPHFMDILPIIFTFSGGNVAPEYHDLQQISGYHTSISSSKCHYFFVHLGDIIAWAKGNVNQNLQ